MAYFEITGIPLRPSEPHFTPTVSLSLEKGKGLTVVSDDGALPQAFVNALTGYGPFLGEIFLNGKRIDPVPARNRPIKNLGDSPGYIPYSTVLQNLEDAMKGRTISEGEAAMLLDREFSEGPLGGFADTPAKSLDESGKTILAATRYLLTGCELLLITKIPVYGRNGRQEKPAWRPGMELDVLFDLKNLLRRFRATWISTLTDSACVQMLSDNIAIFADGNLVQEGSLRECINAPANRRIADFLTFPRMNYKSARIVRDGPFLMLSSGRYSFNVSDFIKRQIVHREGDEVVMGIRPEDVILRSYQAGDPSVLNLGRVLRVDTLPGIQLVSVDLEGQEWVVLADTAQSLFTGQLVELRLDPDRIHIFHPVNATSLLD